MRISGATTTRRKPCKKTMFEQLKEFVVTLRGEVDKPSTDGLVKTVDDLSGKVMTFATAAAGALAAGALATAIRSTADRFNDLGDVIERTGSGSVTELDRLGYVAQLSGSDAATAAASFESLSRTIGEAAKGVGRGAQAFQTFGLSAKNADGSVKSVSQVMDDLRGKLEGMSTAEQQAMIQRLGLDRTMLGVLTTNTDAIAAEYDKRTKALGLDADELAGFSGEFNDAIGRTSRAVSDVFSSFVMRILPALTRAIDRISAFIDEHAQDIAAYVRPIAAGFEIATEVIGVFMSTVSRAVAALGKLPIVVGLIAGAWKVLNLVMSTSPFARIVTAITTVTTVIGLLIDDFETFRKGGNSFFTFWKDVVPIVDAVSNAFKSFSDYIERNGVWKKLQKTAGAALSFIGSQINTVYSLAKAITDTIVGIFTGDIDMITGAWGDFFESVKGWWGDLVGVVSGIGETIDSLFGGFFSGIMDEAAAWINEMIDLVVGFAASIPGRVADAVKSAGKGVVSFVKGFLGIGDDEPETPQAKPAASASGTVPGQAQPGSSAVTAPAAAQPASLVLQPMVMPVAAAPASAIAPVNTSYQTNSKVVNNNQSYTQTQNFNVSSRNDAVAIANGTGFVRMPAGVGG